MSRNSFPYVAALPPFHLDLGAGDVVLPGKTVRIFVGGAGNLVLEDQDGTAATYTVAAGDVVDGWFTRKLAATTATLLVAQFLKG